MIKFLLKTIIVSTAIVAVPGLLIRRLKKLDDEGVFDCKVQIEKSN